MGLLLAEVNKKRIPFCICFVFLFSCFCSSSSSIINGTEIDRLALVEFKTKLIDPQGVMDSWNDTVHVCHWHGVTCTRRHRRVTMLSLESAQLVGSISPSIGNMSFLRNLWLENNSLNGILPSEIGRLRRVRSLLLNNNSIGGEVPSNISRCSNLVWLGLHYNHFVGRIPIEFGMFPNLEFLAIRGNKFVGIIPPSLGNLTLLSSLYLSTNNLVGNVPNSFGRLENLEILDVSLNQLSGVFPPWILNMSRISILDLGMNKFYGSLPLNLGSIITNLQHFSISDNLFSGSIPFSLANASSLRKLLLDTNKFTGEVPSFHKLDKLTKLLINSNFLGLGGSRDLSFISSLINSTNLRILVIHSNNFGGCLPETISNLSSQLTVFDMVINEISGHIPTGMGNLVGLQSFMLWENKFIGNIPEHIGKLQNLRHLGMRENMFSGNIPFSLGNLTKLVLLDLSYNNLQGQIPESLGQCQQLTGFDLKGNNLSGEIPIQVFKLPSLSIVFTVCCNQLSGSLPREVENLKNLGILDVSKNKLSGEIPSNLGSCIRLESLYLQGNLFQGSIPSSLNLLRGLQNLDLSRNNLSGEIPEYFASFQLQQLNLSYNDFQGKVPTRGIFKNASVVSVVGNNRLCGEIPELRLPICNFKSPKKTHTWGWVTVVLCAFVGLVILSLIIYVIWFRKKKKEHVSFSQTFSTNPLLNISYHNLFIATNGFSSENLIGTGSFGSVYKGTFEEGGIIVAVKVLNLQCRGAIKSFNAECEALRNIRHRNLVKVLTACSSIDNHGNDFKALVYEFMANGSLEDWLHLPIDPDEGAPQRRLNFSQRLDILIDVACALDYLHHHCGAMIVHCDLKPSNILLDSELIAHIGDFGLAKFIIHDNATQSSSVGVRGTIGYAPPEYGMANGVSTYGDVYSFGILLLELFTGKRPTDDLFTTSMTLYKYCKEALPKRLVEILDPILSQEMFVREKNVTQLHRMSNKEIMDCLISLFALAISCSAELPKDRPSINVVATSLFAIRNQIH